MDIRKLARYSAYLFLIVGAVVYFISGTYFENSFKVNEKTGTLETSLSQSRIVPLGPRLSGSLVDQKMARRDRFFWVSYEYSLQFVVPAGIPGADSVNYKVSLPGKVNNTNADDAENLTWTKLPQSGQMFATSTYVRWWLIILVILVTGFNIYSYVKKRSAFS